MVVKCTVPRYVGARLSNWSSALTVTLKGEPAVTLAGAAHRQVGGCRGSDGHRLVGEAARHRLLLLSPL